MTVAAALEPAGATALQATAGPAPVGALAANQRMQHLQALIADVEDGPSSFAAALQAAQSGAGAAQTGQPAGTSAATTAGTAIGLAGSTDAAAGLAGTGYPAAAGYPAAGAGTLSAAGNPAGTAIAAAYSPSGSSPSGYPVSAYPAAGVAGASTGVGGYVSGVGAAGTVAGAGASAEPAPTSASAYVPLIEQAAARNGVDPAVLYGLIQQESGFDPSATSGAGAVGLTQLMPGTAASLGVTEPLNPAQSIAGGARYLGEMLRQFSGNVTDALAAYNAGPGAVAQYGGVPPYAETQQYVSKVLANAAAFAQSTAGAATTVGATGATAALATPGAPA